MNALRARGSSASRMYREAASNQIRSRTSGSFAPAARARAFAARSTSPSLSAIFM